MKIIYLSNSIIPSKSANSVHVMKMSSALSEIGNDVTLLARRYNKSELSDIDVFSQYGVKKNFILKIIKSPKIRFSWIWYGFNSYRFIRIRRPDLVYSRELFGAYLSALSGLKTILEYHSPPISIRDRILLPRVLRAKNIIKVVVISEALKRMMIESMPFTDKKNITVAHDGVDLDMFNFPKRKDEAKRALNFHVNDFVLGYTGNLYKGRGIELILEIANRLKQDKFIIAGGRNKDIQRYKDFSKKNNINNIFFLGFFPQSELFNCWNACDILLMPYQNQLFSAHGKKRDSSQWMSPLKMFEYMASGIPIISSDFSVLKEVLENEVNSLLVKPDSVQEWINAINRISKDKNLGQKLAKNARRKVDSYSWKKRARNILVD